MLIQKNNSQKSGKSLRAGSLVLFDHEDTIRLAAVQGFARLKARILTELGTEHELTFSRLTILPEELPKKLHNDQEIVDYLNTLRKQAEQASEQIPLEELWRKVEHDREYSCEDLCQILSDKPSLDRYLALRFKLQAYPLYFKRRKQSFVARTEQELESYKQTLEEREQKTKFLETGLANLQARMKDPTLPLSPEAEKLVRLVLQVAAGAPHLGNQEKRDVKQIIDTFSEREGLSLGGNREERSFKFLSKVHCIHKNTNLALAKHDYPTTHSEEALGEAAKLAAQQKQGDDRYTDYTALEAITIDDSTTKDMDDALTLERTPDGYRLGIHISNVAGLIAPGSIVDAAAKERATSLYLPECTNNMLPNILSEDALSLLQDQERKCISCFYEIGKDFTIKKSSIEPSTIMVRRRYSYDEVDSQLLSGTGELITLYDIAMHLEGERLSQGGIKIPKREVEVILADSSDLEHTDFILKEFDEAGPARSLIGEMMILANTTLAGFAKEQNIPFIYRSQEASDPSERTPDESLSGPAYDYQLKSTLKRSVTSTQYGPHATLGLKIYTQATSPIRRYSDLCNQRQILSYLLTGKEHYSKNELEEVIAEVSQPLTMARLITRETRRCWILRYLQRKHKQKPIEATVLRDDMKNYLVELEEVYIPALLKTPKRLKTGQRMNLTIKEIDPRYDILKLELA